MSLDKVENYFITLVSLIKIVNWISKNGENIEFFYYHTDNDSI